MFRFFEEKYVAEMYKKHRIATPNFIAEELIKWMQEEEVELDTAVDVGCGSGQHTFAIAPHFRRVRAFDISVEQIEEAKRHPAPDNVSFEVSPAEKLPLDDHSVQLVTGGCCFHWFDLEAFYAEVDRVLVPNGVVAAVAIRPISTIVHETKGDELNLLISEFTSKHSLYSHLQTNSMYVQNGYSNLPLPYQIEKRLLNLPHYVQQTLEDLLGTILCFTTTAEVAKERQSQLGEFSESFLKILGLDVNTPPGEVALDVYHKCSLVMSRKPGILPTHFE